MRANLERNGAVAVGFSPPTIARAVQVKGVATRWASPTADDLERAERHFGLFVGRVRADRRSRSSVPGACSCARALS